EVLPRRPGRARVAVGSSGTIRALVGHCASAGAASATLDQVRAAVVEIAAMDTVARRRSFDERRARVIVAGAVILEALMEHCEIDSIAAAPRGLRHGVLVDMIRAAGDDDCLADASARAGRRFGFDERHAGKVAALALRLFDDLGP